MKMFVLFFFAALTALAQANDFPAQNQADAAMPAFERSEKIRAGCIQGRRLICGKIIKVLPDGLVVDSGYTDLLRPPLAESWLLPGTVSATRTPNLIEGREPATVAVGAVFLTDLPKARGLKPQPFDYVILVAYPAGQITYTSVGTVRKTVRRFTGTLGAAVRLNFSAEEKTSTPAAYLQMPATAGGAMPKLLSQTGAFLDTAHLVTETNLLPYDLNVSFWADGAEKTRWISLPEDSKIAFAPAGEWGFPKGTVFVKHFEIATDETKPDVKRRLETRLLVCDSAGGVYGVSYKWLMDNSDAELLETNLTEDILIQTATGVRTQPWYYPSRADCLTCHTANAGFVLGVKTRQLNRDFTYPSGVTENELSAWNQRGWFDKNVSDNDLKKFPKLAATGDPTRSLEDRARSYLDANCAQCHRPQGTVGYFDARYDTPLARQNLNGGRVLIDQRIEGARVIAPNDVWRSILFMRMNTTEAFKMPPLAHNRIDERGVKLLREWIGSLPGPRVLAPPEISPRGGNFSQPTQIVLQGEPGANIFYTLDGTVPTADDLPYARPFLLAEPTIVRAKAFMPGCTKSITAQEIFLIGE